MLNSKAIDTILNEFLNKNDFECTVEMGTDFAYWTDTDTITYSLVVSERMDKLFMEYALAQGLKVDCGIFLLSFFHELGHYMTIDDLTDKEETQCEKAKSKLTDSDADCMKYFSLLDEFLATSWAVEYINEHLAQIEELAANLQAAIAQFLQDNNIG